MIDRIKAKLRKSIAKKVHNEEDKRFLLMKIHFNVVLE